MERSLILKFSKEIKLQGNRRGPVKRWDFEDHEDYEKYMESKEAMPK